MIIRVIKVFVMFSKEVIPSSDIVLRQLKIAYDTLSRSQVSLHLPAGSDPLVN